ncbi:DUF2690 domain-containing protein [Streptomyces litmocidini]|uniref:DUF2690 domain-containing protein n=1 Tax=Streptomyces litmocidini TaxID=67318 RepID=A0ABW7U618_9ACTN|nr:DUF2690 domain-containing protein [Streptomyces sp. PanSC19]ROQ35439.1 uncharacterized protein DUF2690 [Streptomyces sp. PanSC19]
MKRMIAKVAGVSAAAMTMALVPLAGTSYAAGCTGAGCDNLGPVSQACDGDAVTKASVSDGIDKAELRWSPKCQAAWVRVTDPYGPDNWWDHLGYIEKHNGYAGPLVRSLSVKIPDPGSDWSNMLGGSGYYYRVCLKDTGTGDVTCSTYW